MSPYTLRSHLQFLFGDSVTSRKVPQWPPDLFGAVASILHCTGAYRRVIETWPPRSAKNPTDWVKSIRSIGHEWRFAWRPQAASRAVPEQVAGWWTQVIRKSAVDLSKLPEEEGLCDTLIQLLAASDEACLGFGIPGAGLDFKKAGFRDAAYDLAQRLLIADPEEKGATLCRRIHPTKLRVLPRLHTPQTGLTIRSMSHNICLCPANEIIPVWSVIPRAERKTQLNLLLLPWPLAVSPEQFSAVPTRSYLLANLPDRYGLFRYSPAPDADFQTWVSRQIAAARTKVGRIDGVVLPELSLTRAQFETVRRLAVRENAFLISGLVGPPHQVGQPGRNYLRFEIPLAEDYVFSLPEQDKHHRWQLERSQISRYGLGGRLDPNRLWWEHSRLESRLLNFVPLYDWLTVSVLICEDLARPDPVGDLVRAVGPNLVVALLMDGPQTIDRWSSRYAAVLADDPGCSVLTLTSLGMPGLGGSKRPEARNIALWKDAKSGAPTVISVEEGSSALVLRLSMQEFEEWTADGRSDRGTTCYPALDDIVQVG